MNAPALLITGATGPLAEPVVRVLADRGHRLLLTGRNAEKLAELDQRYGSPGVIETFQVDAAQPDGAQQAAARAAERFDGLGGLVHLIGRFGFGPVMLTDIAVYDELIMSNFRSAVVATQAVLPHLTEGGRLVYFSTPLAVEPLAALSAYSAAKAALTTWVRSMAHEVKRRGIHANVVSMTIADTPKMRAERPGLDLDHTVDPALVARAVGFLTSPESDGLYGSVVPVLGKFSYSSVLAGGPPPGVGGPPPGAHTAAARPAAAAPAQAGAR
ncbi:SDR family oxidoreductase [Microlunatus parietis]|uniref:NAD(P)-dependent dehydrogenase (Short-subunit alcohol dehydrogenase family) n=1 Tax=Microlunatus parietis TaxID=682979 RepID=A0A7Y9LDQ2_9ACTN|nr:SDR family oxidoreductase [Microlunatus parietis]NYE73108.1 NAD(P)-dependent dehydrogenase (short-subunit alcohol dehydrogenase family) [Microlunatus parietis]